MLILLGYSLFAKRILNCGNVGVDGVAGVASLMHICWKGRAHVGAKIPTIFLVIARYKSLNVITNRKKQYFVVND